MSKPRKPVVTVAAFDAKPDPMTPSERREYEIEYTRRTFAAHAKANAHVDEPPAEPTLSNSAIADAIDTANAEELVLEKIEAATADVKAAVTALLTESKRTETKKVQLAFSLLALYRLEKKTYVLEHDAMNTLCTMADVSQTRRAAKKEGAPPLADATFLYSAREAVRMVRVIIERADKQCDILRGADDSLAIWMPANIAETKVKAGDDWVDNINTQQVRCRPADLDRVYKSCFAGTERSAAHANAVDKGSKQAFTLQALKQVSISLLVKAFFSRVANTEHPIHTGLALLPTPKEAFTEADIEVLLHIRNWIVGMLPLDKADKLAGELATMSAIAKQRDADYEAEYERRIALEAKLAAITA